jgi:AcrR family transcriptional regulator
MEETRSKEDVLKQFREETLTDAARKIIASEGFLGVTIERVAELAGVSKGTIYLYFKNKDDLIRATILNTFSTVMDQVRETTERETTFHGKMRALVTTQLNLFASNQAFFRALLSDTRHGPKPQCGEQDDVVAKHLEFARYISGLIEYGRDTGAVRPAVDPQETAFFVIHLLQSTGMRHLIGLTSTQLGNAAEIDRILDFIANGVGTHGD